MLKKSKNKGQNTAEYAILIALVVGAVIAMQTYAQRGLQARTRGTSLWMGGQIKNQLDVVAAQSGSGIPTGVRIGQTNQYVPYYEDTKQQTQRDASESTFAGALTGKNEESTRKRLAAPAQGGGYSTTTVGQTTAVPAYGYEKTVYNELIGKQTQD